MEQQEIISRLMSVCEHFRLSNAAFANNAGIGTANFAKMMKGEQKITDKTLKKISSTYGISFEWLLNGTGEMIETEVSITNYQSGKNITNEQNSSQLFMKALDEIAAQRQLVQEAQRMLAEVIRTHKEQSDRFLSILEKSLEK